ncbi:MAG: MtrB/PioB family outer membrane beta-barrel protein [Proteobacteria bacterium]|nr:MtrB/PioB family outer membrane beta-barrel protein [Pseudomonadota bacterium]MBU1648436.1 MtrB/PioB family outer membrane beta-barrel protein [Pseudomonadota bacterium]MBU1985751.1 MtrB/PioB family outer membrane beta-barrel protein [Pseudomonadota bacterium]
MPSTAGEPLPVEPEDSLTQQDRGTEEELPSREAEGFFSLGYRSFSLHNSEKVEEYQDPYSSLLGELDISSYLLPHRFHITSEYLSADNYYGDAGYAFSDLLLMRDIFTRTYHNLAGYNYQYAGEAPAITYDDRSAGEEYHVDVFNNFFSVRLKAPDYPFHTFLKHRYLDKGGLFQQRFVIGSLGSVKKVSQSREIDWQSKDLTIGTNCHLGPVEAEYSSEFTKFDPGRNNILYDLYPATSIRPADIYPHDVIPETESAANSLKVHSSYTGGLVAAATLSTITQKNNYSDSKSDTWQGVTDLSYIFDPNLTFYFKYRHRDMESSNPDSVTLRGLVNTTSYPVRQAISYKKDILSLSARYLPAKKVTITSDYEFSYRERTNTDQWLLLSDHSETNRIKLAAQASPFNSLKVKLSTDYCFLHNPALNIEPDSSNQVQFLTTYLPASWVTAFFSYNRAITERDNLRYLNNDPNIVVDGGRRETKNDRFLASLSFLFSPKITLTTSFAHYHSTIEQNLAYARWNSTGTAGDLPFLDPAVPYTDDADNYSLSLFYVPPLEGVSITTTFSYTLSEGNFMPNLTEAQNPVSLASYSELKVAETAWILELTKSLPNNWEIGLEFLSNRYNDRYDNSQVGSSYTSICTVKRYF